MSLCASLYKHGNEAGETEKWSKRCSHVIFMKYEINLFYQNHEQSLASYSIKILLFILCHCSTLMLTLCDSLMHCSRLTCTDFWIPAGKGAPLCLIHHLAHYYANGLISTALLTIFCCLGHPAATSGSVLLP